jgi:prepilin-type N-terminal cleavage/methylation domain-containing protein
MTARTNRAGGFTLLELVMAMAVGLVLLAAVWTAVWSGQRSSVGIERKVTTNQDTRAILDMMAMEIRMASYNPTLETGSSFWPNPADCGAGVQIYKGIPVATDSSITVSMNIDGDNAAAGAGGKICGNNEGEIVSYAYDAVNSRITRETITCLSGTRTSTSGGPQTMLGPIADAQTVRVINGTLPVFRYYKADGTRLNPDGTPMAAALIPDIRRIEIVLLVESEAVDPGTGQRRQMAYSTSVIPRNHGINFKK